jgi:hypothetical protein
MPHLPHFIAGEVFMRCRQPEAALAVQDDDGSQKWKCALEVATLEDTFNGAAHRAQDRMECAEIVRLRRLVCAIL